VVLPLAVIAANDDPAVVAGHAVVASLGPGGQDPLNALLDSAGLDATLRLLARGTLPDDVLADAAAALTQAPFLPPASSETAAAFALAALPTGPYLRAIDPDGQQFGNLPAPAGAASEPILSDGDWLALRGICDV